nr:MAG TPA: hypothetical protein [Crassvirales sp.]
MITRTYPFFFTSMPTCIIHTRFIIYFNCFNFGFIIFLIHCL